MERLSDEALVERCRAETGSPVAEAALSELFERHHARVAAWTVWITGDANSAADLAQEIFLKAFQRLPSFRRDSKFTTWLYSITRNHCLDELRSRKIRPEEASDLLSDETEDLSLKGVISDMERRQSEELFRQLMQESLDEVENKVMTLHYFHEVPLDSVSRMLGLSNPSGAKAHVVSARRKLKRAYERWKSSNETTRGGRRAE